MLLPDYESGTVQTKQMHDVLCMQASKDKVEFTWKQMLICRGDGKAGELLHVGRGHERKTRGRRGQEQAHFLP